VVTANEAPANNENSSAQSSFLNDTANLPAEVAPEIDGAGVAPAAAAVQVTGWTADSVAEQFSGMFTLISVIAPALRPGPGKHWQIPAEDTRRLGDAYLPIFIKHVPYGTGAPPWLADAIMWIGAIGATKEIVWPALQIELQLLRESKKKKQPSADPSFPESTQTETSAGSSSSPASAEVENLLSNSGSLDSAKAEF
jgi:hypothetical protein